MFFKSGREERLQRHLEELSRNLAEASGQAQAIEERLKLLDDYEGVKKALTDKQIELDRVKEEHARKEREIEHKLGLHRIQVDQERTSAVTEAKLAVREEALVAAQDRHQEQITFIRERMENEMDAHRAILNEVLSRLPHFTHSRVEHVGTDPNPPAKLEITKGDAA